MNLISMAKDLLNIKETYQYYIDYKKLKEAGYGTIHDDDFNIYMFEQIWGNTSGGFQSMGGCAMTTQMTYVLIPKISYDDCFVFFEGVFAYKVPYSRRFINDVIEKMVEGKSGYEKYLEQE